MLWLVVVIIMLLFHPKSCLNDSVELEECIKSHRIIGGFCTPIVDRPFEVLVFIGTSPKFGGSIISKRWVLTAAHCVRNLPVEHFVISVGSARIGGQSARYHTVDKTIVHEDFVANQSTTANDIALMRTTRSIKFNERVRPVELNRVLPKAGDDTMVSGFGVESLENRNEMSRFLMSVEGKVIERNQCQLLLWKVRPRQILSNGTFCAGNLVGGKDSCHGDSGGPITIGTVLAGIVSWGVSCAEKMMPAFYTDVAYYFDWISNNTQHERTVRRKTGRSSKRCGERCKKSKPKL